MTYRFQPLPFERKPIETLENPVHCVSDLGRRWRTLMGDLGFGERLIWFGFIGPNRIMVQALHQMAIPRDPMPRHGEELFTLLAGVLEEMPDDAATVALLLTRPGSGPISDSDRRWSTMLTETAAQFDVPIEPIFRANDEGLVLVEPTRTAA